jgi:hypothetical protein
MKINALVKLWEDNATARLTKKEYHLRLPLQDAARIAALAEMYPKRNQEEIIGELLSAALDELETSFPYVKGTRVVAEDEQGDPMFEDLGPTPRFLDLSKKFMALLKQEQEAANK